MGISENGMDDEERWPDGVVGTLNGGRVVGLLKISAC